MRSKCIEFGGRASEIFLDQVDRDRFSGVVHLVLVYEANLLRGMLTCTF